MYRLWRIMVAYVIRFVGLFVLLFFSCEFLMLVDDYVEHQRNNEEVIRKAKEKPRRTSRIIGERGLLYMK